MLNFPFVLFFLFEELLSSLSRIYLLVTKSSSHHSSVNVFIFISKNWFCQIQNYESIVLFIQDLKNILTFSFSWSHMRNPFIWCFPTGISLFFSGCFQEFLSLVFKSLIMMCIDMDSWDLSCLEFLESLCWYFSSNLASFQSLFLQIFIHSSLFSLCFIGLQWYECWIFCY